MNHPKGYSGRVRLTAPLPLSSPYLPRVTDGVASYVGLRLDEETQRAGREKLNYDMKRGGSTALPGARGSTDTSTARVSTPLWRP